MDSGEESVPMYDENAEESAEPAAHHGGCSVRLENFLKPDANSDLYQHKLASSTFW